MLPLEMARSRPWRLWLIGFLMLIAAGAGATILLLPSENAVLVLAPVQRGTVVQSVDVVGTVKAEVETSLRFKARGTIRKIHVGVGDKVWKGDLLLELDAEEFTARLRAAEADIRTAEGEVSKGEAAVKDAKASLQKVRDGTRTEEVDVAVAGVSHAEATLEAARQSLIAARTQQANGNIARQKSEETLAGIRRQQETDLSGKAASAYETTASQYAVLDHALSVIESALQDNGAADTLAFQKQSLLAEAEQSRLSAVEALAGAVPSRPNFTTPAQAAAEMKDALDASDAVSVYADLAFAVFQNTIVSSTLSQSALDAFRASMSEQRQAVVAARNALVGAIALLRDTEEAYAVQIARQQESLTEAMNAVRDALEKERSAMRSVEEAERLVEMRKAELALAKAPPLVTSVHEAEAKVEQAEGALQALSARLDSARAALTIAQSQWNDTVLHAPMDGTVTDLPVEEGEFASEQVLAISISGSAPSRVESMVPDVDIPLVQLGNSAALVLDAFPDTPFPLRVTHIEPSAIVVDGVPKYKVTLMFVTLEDTIRNGQTGDVTIETQRREQAIYIPQSALMEREGHTYVQVAISKWNAEPREVTTGITGEQDTVEIISGLQEGEEIVLSPAF
jgi:HlyD family secretion protein